MIDAKAATKVIPISGGLLVSPRPLLCHFYMHVYHLQISGYGPVIILVVVTY